jgi:hypothetical protein
MTGSLRSRLEQQDLAAKEARVTTPVKANGATVRERLENAQRMSPPAVKSPEEERREKLKAKAAAIRQQNLEIFLHAGDATEDEITVVRNQIGAECPQHLANVDVYNSKLLRLRTEGPIALAAVLDILDDDVKREVLEILATKSAEARTGADGGAGARTAVTEYFAR